tara:strand:- start:225 stop:1118 length:894 start_codon:yes stop_codon:yes gene_type:complete
MKKLCIYHGNCADGFGAAWAVRHALGDDVEFYPGHYGHEAPDVTGRDVILVDFSYKLDVLQDLSFKANSILILDHHKSAQEDLKGLEPVKEKLGYKGFFDELGTWCASQNKPLIGALFDMDRSGAMIAWDFFHDEPAPKLIQHIQDRDLWRFELPGTKEIQACVFSYPYDFELWDQLMTRETWALEEEGSAILRKHMKDVNELIKVAAHRTTIAGYDVPVMNAPYFYSSEAGNIMSEGEPFAACYYETAKGRVYSLRSKETGVDVSVIASLFGGGGHKNAAGFRIDFDKLNTLQDAA